MKKTDMKNEMKSEIESKTKSKNRNNKIKKYMAAAAAISALSLTLTGCGKTDDEKELADFSSAISSFTNSIQDADTRMNELDVSEEDARETMLEILDNLETTFQELAELPVPDQYKSIETLADEASENMTTAVSYFHTAYEAESYSEQDADVAIQYYMRAMTRVEYIGYVLIGEIPEKENVTVYEEQLDNKILDMLLQDEEDADSAQTDTTTEIE